MKNHLLAIMLVFCLPSLDAQITKDSLFKDDNFSGLKLRSIGPAFMAGRIADIAIHPDDDNIWYAAVGSGGVWKTVNAGTTWKPIFDTYSVFSTGCITIDPNNPHTVWLGTGENVGGRHMSFGDGIYKSEDDGQSWKNMGLKESQHISKIIVHPDNSNILWAAVQGPLWNKGGERGLYKSTDGGKEWTQVLGDSEWVGVTDVVIDPRDPDRLYAATWQRHRTVAAYMGGGPGSGLHRSTDGGETWEKLSKGLPTSNMGKIGLAISPQKPDVLYAAIELDRRKGGIYKTTNRGSSWTKQSDAVSGGTGPHYYQELYASPHAFDRIYLMDVRVQVSDDGGKTVRRLSEKHKHSDNHALAFRSDDPDYLLMGTDGGIYESFDLAKNWRFNNNMPITQYYKVAVDDAEPFYNIYGGTQDNNTHGGPSRTDNLHGIRNADWFITLFADGHQPATEPGNPDIMYSEWQQGNLMRIDRTTGEMVYIKPQPEAGAAYERYNWDAPILVSPHNPQRLYFGSQRVWRSENRGDDWTAISDDLTRNDQRIELPIMGQTLGWDEPWDIYAMSNYSTITSLAESPVQEDLIYAGTDDGIIQVSDDAGAAWRKIEVGSLPGVPSTAFVNDIKADLYDANTVYVALDNHKFGDLKPYLLKSTNEGQSWTSMTSNLPDKTLVWRIVQDHVDKDLFFLGTEFGIYFTVDGGQMWTKLKGGVPTISFRDLAIQRRENDLVGASFGRSFYVFDDYSLLRDVSTETLNQEAHLFDTRKAWWYIPKPVLSFDTKASQGSSYYVARNPDFGATFTYYLSEDYLTDREVRQKAEKDLKKDKKTIKFPGWETVEAERRQAKAKIWLIVKNGSGETIRRLEGSTKKGFHRVAWDLKYPKTAAIKKLDKKSPNKASGFMAAPGTYTVTLAKEINGVVTMLSEPKSFEVEKLRDGALKGSSPKETAAFWRQLEDLGRRSSAASALIANKLADIKLMQAALYRSNISTGELDSDIHAARNRLLSLDERINQNRSKREVGEKGDPTVADRLSFAVHGTSHATYGPNASHRKSLELGRAQFEKIRLELEDLLKNVLPAISDKLSNGGAPWIPGSGLPEE